MPSETQTTPQLNMGSIAMPLSQLTIDVMREHMAYKSAGAAWRARNDPRAKQEQAIRNDVQAALQQDFDLYLESLPDETFRAIQDEWHALDFDAQLDQLLEVVKKVDQYQQ